MCTLPASQRLVHEEGEDAALCGRRQRAGSCVAGRPSSPLRVASSPGLPACRSSPPFNTSIPLHALRCYVICACCLRPACRCPPPPGTQAHTHTHPLAPPLRTVRPSCRPVVHQRIAHVAASIPLHAPCSASCCTARPHDACDLHVVARAPSPPTHAHKRTHPRPTPAHPHAAPGGISPPASGRQTCRPSTRCLWRARTAAAALPSWPPPCR